jgi:hypothetical protein
VAGGVTFGSLWLLSALVGAALTDIWNDDNDVTNDDVAWPLFIPAAGPFIGIGTMEPQSMATFMLVLDGVAQIGGVAMFIGGLVATKDVLVADEYAGAELQVAPLLTEHAAGIALRGSM